MSRIPRRIVLLAGLAVCGIAGALFLGSGNGLSPEERRLVGTWRRSNLKPEEEWGLSLTIAEDRTYSLEKLNVCSKTRKTYFVRGTWCVDGGEFVWEDRLSSHQISSSLPLPVDRLLCRLLRFGRKAAKSPLRFLEPDRLQLDLEEWGIEGREYDRFAEPAKELVQQ